MFHIHSKLNGGLYDHISHELDDNIFHAIACYVGPSPLDFPERRMMMTPSLLVLDQVLSGKEKGVSIDKIQILAPSDAGSVEEGAYRLGRVTRITRFNASAQGVPRYLVESTVGNILDGDVDGRWSSYKRTVLFDAGGAKRFAPMGLAEGGAAEIGGVKTDILVFTLDLYAIDGEKTAHWWQQTHPELDNKAPSELETLAEYQKLLVLLRGLKQIVLSKGETQDD
ncbi:hypothetical protein [Pseudomonas sp. 44 R 15]|uniref:hypothetical protein n=1 Tax=Pseudomonas sp. 44 R 15 TaxID=1844105 RepID=UPI0008121E43|nr:hypothetical protein [Pseudomonas sp. 44 R 15]CRM67206.1 hypothetical protein [Pseudomonas sp. 44 R 15]